MANATPWLGQAGKLRKQRVVKKSILPDENAKQLDSSPPTAVVTRHGHQVRRPARYRSSDTPEGLSLKGGGSCEANREESREKRQSPAKKY